MPNSLSPKILQALEKALNSDRLKRYQDGTDYDPAHSLRLYMWNAELCESFYFPLQVAEVLVRNAVHNCVSYYYKQDWWRNTHFLNELKSEYRQELAGVISEEKASHPQTFTGHHVVSGMSFGFWESLLNTRFRHLLWKNSLKYHFPNLPKLPITTVQDVQDKIMEVRQWRNRVAHHSAIFDKAPEAKHELALTLIGWVCADTAAYVRSVSKFDGAFARKPLRVIEGDAQAAS
ncbi:MAG TPA: Abi family protein [Reyranella sp.]|jgi:hypothetical protein